VTGRGQLDVRRPAPGDAAIRRGSKSFALASRLFAPATRELVWDLYTWCRHCDDVIDGQVLGWSRRDVGDGPARLQGLREATRAAFAGDADPASPFGAIGRVAAQSGLPRPLADEHLDGFAMDIAARRYETIDDTIDYCYHVAGVVGLMMAWVMGVRDQETLCRASDLGIAFQLTNISRDVVEDARAGRIYLPAVWLAEAGLSIAPEAAAPVNTTGAIARVVHRLLGEADRYYASAWYGVAALPPRSAWAVATARLVYRAIGRRVVARGASAWETRTVVGRPRTIACVAAATGQVSWLLTAGRLVTPPPRTGLFTPPVVAVLR
jgi:phytoene synthase